MGRLATDTPAGVYNSGNALFFWFKNPNSKNFGDPMGTPCGPQGEPMGTPWGPQVPKFSVYTALKTTFGRTVKNHDFFVAVS